MDIILIRPQYNLASSLYAKAGKNGVKESYPSLGLHYLAAKLVQGGFSVEIIDCMEFQRSHIFPLPSGERVSPALLAKEFRISKEKRFSQKSWVRVRGS